MMRPLPSRVRTTRPWSARTNTSRGTTRGALALPTVGRSITEGVMSGAVTMKMTSSTSITSMYGTTLISCIGPRLRRSAAMLLLHGLPVKDVRELFHEALEAVGEPLDVVRVAVVRHDRRNRGEQADRGRHQRLGNARGDLGEGRLLHVGEAAECVHDAPHRAEEPDVRADRAGRGEEREVALDEVHLALEGGAHRAARAVDHVARLGAALAAQLGELAEARLEHALEAADVVAVVHRALVEGVQVVAAPELALELIGLGVGPADREPLLEDEHPRHERDGEQQEHHHFDDEAGVDDQRPDVEVLRNGHLNACCSSAGTRAGLIRSRSTLARSISASTRSSEPRSTRWRNTRLARPILTTSADTDSMSFSRPGAW